MFDLIAFWIAEFPVGIMTAPVLSGRFEDDASARNLVVSLLALGTFLGYYLILEGMFGRTLGKLLTGSRVVRRDGGRPSFGQILGRTAARLIPFEPFSVLFTKDGIGWHDSLSGTIVIKVNSERNA